MSGALRGRQRFSFPPRTYRYGPPFARAPPLRVLAPSLRSSKKPQAVRNPCQLRTLRKALCLWKAKPQKIATLSKITKVSMITHSFFRVTCVCGEQLRSESKTGTCPSCKREFRIEWPADYEHEREKPGAVSIEHELGMTA
jgi:hypothetical protein